MKHNCDSNNSKSVYAECPGRSVPGVPESPHRSAWRGGDGNLNDGTLTEAGSAQTS